MTLPQPRTIRGVIDQGDLTHVRSLGINPTHAEPCPLGGNGIINPHVTRFYHDGKVTDVFHIKPIYYEAIDHSWRPMGEVASHHGNKNIVLKTDWARKMSMRYFRWLMNRQRLFKGSELLIDGYVLQPRHMAFATVSTFYPDPNVETTTVDGYLESAYGVWATIRAQANASVTNDSDAAHYFQSYRDGGGSLLKRHVYLFDTSTIPDSDTVSGAVISFYKTATAVTNSDATETFDVVTSNPAANTSLTAADYNISNFGSSTLGSKSLSTMSLSAYFDITLNSVASISKTGVTKLGHRMGLDLSNTNPTSGGNQSDIRTADYTGTSSDPKLVVTHASTGITVTPAAQVATFSIPTATYKHGSTLTPSAQTSTFSIPAYSIVGKAVISANAFLATFSIPAYAIIGDGNVTTSPAAQVATFSVPTYAVSVVRNIIVSVNAVVATFSTPARTLGIGTGVTVAATVALLTLSIPAVTLTLVRYISVTVATQILTFSIPTLRKVGGVWTRISRSTSGSDWTRSERNNT